MFGECQRERERKMPTCGMSKEKVSGLQKKKIKCEAKQLHANSINNNNIRN